MTVTLPAVARSPEGVMNTTRALIRVESRSQMTGIEREWKQLAAVAQPQNPFLSWAWQRSWLEACSGAEPLIVAAPFAQGGLAGLLALQRRWRVGLRQIECLGQDSGGDDLDCLLHPQAPPDTASRLLTAALRRRDWDVLRLESVCASGALASALAHWGTGAAIRESGERLPFLPLPRQFDAYLATRSANFRSEIRRRRRVLYRRVPNTWLECSESPSRVLAALDHLFRLHNLRRAQLRERGIFHAGSLRGFHRQAAGQLAAAGEARVYLLRDGRVPIAGLYGFRGGNRFFYFQSGFDPAWTALSPGTVLLSEVIEDCIRRGEEGFEFLRGDEGYKGRWTSQCRISQRWLAASSGWGKAYLGLRQWRRRQREQEETG